MKMEYKAIESSRKWANVFGDWYRDYPHPITDYDCKQMGVRDILDSSTDFKDFVHKIFGYDSPKLIRLISMRLISVIDIAEYAYDLQEVNDRKVHKFINADLTAVEFEERVKLQTIMMAKDAPTVSGIKRLNELTTFKKEYAIDWSLFIKGYLLKDLLSLDHLYVVIENHQLDRVAGSQSNVNVIKEFLKLFHTNKILKLVRENELYSHNMTDSIAQYNSYQHRGCTIPSDWKDLTELHDQISWQVRTIKADDENKPITYDDDMKKYFYNVHIEKTPLALTLPMETKILHHWGMELNNCIASYDQRVLDGKTYVIGVYKNGKLTYAIEYRPDHVPKIEGEESALNPQMRITQFYAKKNTRPESEDEVIVREYFRQVETGLLLHKLDVSVQVSG